MRGVTPKWLDLFCRQQRDFRDLFRVGIGVVMGVADEQLMMRQHQHLHDGERMHAGAQADHVADRGQMIGRSAERAAEHGVAYAVLEEPGREQRAVSPHLRHRQRARNAVAFSRRVIGVRRLHVDLGDLGDR